MENISENVTFDNWINYEGKEFFKIENTPNEEQIGNGKRVAERIYEPLVTQFGEVITIETGFLNSKLNQKISKEFNFDKGDALKISSEKSAEVFNYIKDYLEFDTLIWMLGKDNPCRIYVSYNAENRKQILRAKFNFALKKLECTPFEISTI